jgi:hypothetical protein
VKKSVEESSLVDLACAKGLHPPDHTAAVIAGSIRVLAMIRGDARIHSKIGDERKVHDMLQRGHTLLQKIGNATEDRIRRREHVITSAWDELDKTRSSMQDWVASLAKAAEGIEDAALLGRIGYLPDGKGLPLGGTSFAVVLHERGQGAVPDPSNVGPTSGWSVGRQGRNRENLGQGY